MRGWLPAVLVAFAVVGCGGDGDDGAPGRIRVGGGNGGQPAGGDNLPPAAVITTSQVAGPGLAVTFNGAASTDSDGFIVEHLWAFGDGTTGRGPVVSHVFPAPGNFTVLLTVTDNDGARDTASITISVGGSADINLRPGAVFTPTPRSGAAPLTVTFDATLSTDSDGLIVEHQWDFGDGTRGSGPLISHTFTAAGIYPVQLTVVDDAGAVGIATQSLVVTGMVSDTGGALPPPRLSSGSVGVNARAIHTLQLQAGEPVVVSYPTAQIARTDLDLFLFDLADPQHPQLVASSVGLGDVEAVVAPAAGEFALLVEAVGDGTEYELRRGGELPAPTPALDASAGNEMPQLQGGRALSPEAPPAVTGDPFWSGQPLEADYRTLRRAKQAQLDPAAATTGR